MKSKKMDEKIYFTNLTNKIFENALRMFESEVTKPQLKSLKNCIKMIAKEWDNNNFSHTWTHNRNKKVYRKDFESFVKYGYNQNCRKEG